MNVQVNIPAPLRQYCNKQKQVNLSCTDVTSLLKSLNTEYNLLYSKICDEQGNLRQYVNLYINGIDIKKQDSLQTALKAGDVVNIIPAVAGGVYVNKNVREVQI